jgi:hypothetical protein
VVAQEKYPVQDVYLVVNRSVVSEPGEGVRGAAADSREWPGTAAARPSRAIAER